MFDDHPVEEYSYANFSRNGLIGSKRLTSNKYFRSLLEWFKEDKEETLFLPTGALRLMKILNRFFPHHSLLVADYDYITEITTGHYGPVISKTRSPYRDTDTDFTSHLVEIGQADIYHSVSFPLLKYMYDNVAVPGNDSSTLMSQDEFLYIWARTADSAVMNGYNPMMMDFAKRMLVRGRMNVKPSD
jgi:hypothetical protein